MKKTITFVIGGLLVLGGFTGGVIYKNSTDNEVTSEYNKSNSDEIKNENTEVNESKNNKDKVKVSHERLSEITNAEIGAAGEEANKNPNYTKDDINRAVADKLKSIGVTKEEAKSCNIDEDIIKYFE